MWVYILLNCSILLLWICTGWYNKTKSWILKNWSEINVMITKAIAPCGKFSKLGLVLSILVNFNWALHWWSMRKNCFWDKCISHLYMLLNILSYRTHFCMLPNIFSHRPPLWEFSDLLKKDRIDWTFFWVNCQHDGPRSWHLTFPSLLLRRSVWRKGLCHEDIHVDILIEFLILWIVPADRSYLESSAINAQPFILI